MLIDFTDIAEMMRQVFEEARQDIITRHEQAGQVASGKTRDGIKVEVTEDMNGATATMYGRPYFASLETGSKPWTKQYKHPPKPFVDTISEWMSDKGITGVSAYLVARKIMQEGSLLHRNPDMRPDIFTTPMKEVEQKISDRISSILDSITTKTLLR